MNKAAKSMFMLQKLFFIVINIYVHVKGYGGGVGVHIRVCCNFLSGDSSKFAVVMVVSGRVLAG